MRRTPLALALVATLTLTAACDNDADGNSARRGQDDGLGEGEGGGEAEGEGEGSAEGEGEGTPSEGEGEGEGEEVGPHAPPPVRDCDTELRFRPEGPAGSVSVAGEWSEWSTDAHPLTDVDGSGTFRASVTIPPGSWGYKFVVDGQWLLDPMAPMTRYVGEFENSRIDVGDCREPELRLHAAEATPEGAVTLVVAFIAGTDGAAPDPAAFVVEMDRRPFSGEAEYSWSSHQLTLRAEGLPAGRHTFRVAGGVEGGAATPAPVVVPMWIEPEPFRWSDGPMYSVLVDRFRNGDLENDAPIPNVTPQANYKGGDLAGVLEALEEGWFEELGVRVLWLSPLYDNAESPGSGKDGRNYSGYHGYWPRAPRAIEPRLGTIDELRAVTGAAHARGIRVIVDLVLNHVHSEHPYFSEHRDWFNGDGSCICGDQGCGWDERALDCWFRDYLPDVDWTNPAAVDAMIDDALWWIEAADVDGYRVDAAKHMPAIAVTTLRARIRERYEGGNARFYLVGETFTGAGGHELIESHIGPGKLHAQFDFPLLWPILDAFAHRSGGLDQLDAAVRQGEERYSSDLMAPFLGNHDIDRFLSVAAGQIRGDSVELGYRDPPGSPDSDLPYAMAALAHAFVLTQPGVPLIYYGDEIGMPGAGDPDNRRMMRFADALSDRERGLLETVRKIGHARSTMPGLRRGGRTTLHVDANAYAYARGTAAEAVVVLLHRGGSPRSIRVALPDSLAVPEGRTFVDAISGESATVADGALPVDLGPHRAYLFVAR